MIDALCHPGDLPGVGISSEWVTANSWWHHQYSSIVRHPDDLTKVGISSGWYTIPSGWDTLPFLSHPDEIENFDFPQHAVVLQRFRIDTRTPLYRDHINFNNLRMLNVKLCLVYPSYNLFFHVFCFVLFCFIFYEVCVSRQTHANFVYGSYVIMTLVSQNQWLSQISP